MPPIPLFLTALLILSAATATAADDQSDALSADPTKNLFAIITHKGGAAAGMAHNHFIVATKFDAHFTATPGKPEDAKFTLQLPVASLQSDPPQLRERVAASMKATGVSETTLSDIKENDRAKIQEHMLAKDQLDAAHFPTITARLTRLTRVTGKESAFEAEVVCTIHGRTVTKKCTASVEKTDRGLHVLAHGGASFTEFGIKPYAAMMGAVKNKNEFDIIADFIAPK